MSISHMESRSLEDGGQRVKFTLTRLGTIEDYFHGSSVSSDEFRKAAAQLTDALTILKECGATPILPDGKISGNGSVRISATTGDREYDLLVSKSGKTFGEKIDPENDTCIVTHFNPENWSAEYYSSSESVFPTSDTPLHYSILHASHEFLWSEIPMATLHGHSLDSLEAAELLHLPCSKEETMFSTADDLRALLDLAGLNPYPQNKIFIRRKHGFFILGKDVPDALKTFRTIVEPYLKAKKID